MFIVHRLIEMESYYYQIQLILMSLQKKNATIHYVQKDNI